MPKKKLPPAHRPVTSDAEAGECIASAFVYFFRCHPLKTAIACVLFFGAPGIVTYKYFTTDRIHIEDAQPIGADFHVVPDAFAGGQPLMIEGKQYGWIDADFECWKLAGENALLVYHKPSRTIKRVLLESSPEQFKSRK